MHKQTYSLILGTVMGIALASGAVIAGNYEAIQANFPILLNGSDWSTDKPIFTIYGRTYLPLRALGEALDVKVDWNNELQRVEIGEPAPRFYPDFPDIPNFAFYVNAILEYEKISENGSSKFYIYSLISMPDTQTETLYIDALKEYGFQYSRKYGDDEDVKQDVYTKGNSMVGIAFLHDSIAIVCSK